MAGEEQQKPPAGEAQRFPGCGVHHPSGRQGGNGIEAFGAIVRLFNGTPKDRTDDTVVELARAALEIKRG